MPDNFIYIGFYETSSKCESFYIVMRAYLLIFFVLSDMVVSLNAFLAMLNARATINRNAAIIPILKPNRVLDLYRIPQSAGADSTVSDNIRSFDAVNGFKAHTESGYNGFDRNHNVSALCF